MFRFLKKNTPENNHVMLAITDGELIPIEQVADPVFSTKMLGNGIAIIPKSRTVVAPCKGKITMIYPTLHAFGIKTVDGIDVLIHIGIDTVNLKGKGFFQHVQVDQEVNANDTIISFDKAYLKDKNLDFTTMMMFPNCHYQLEIKSKGYVSKGRDVVVTFQ